MSVCEAGSIIQISAGPHDRQHAVVTVSCEGVCQCASRHVLSEIDETGNTVGTLRAQCHGDEMTFIIPQMAAGEVKRYEITTGAEVQAGVAIEEKDGQLDFLIDGELFTSYVIKPAIARPYCYPIHGPGGIQMTNLGPSDHVHHRSLYVAQGEVNGHDNWSELAGHARTVNRSCETVSQGPVYAELLARNDWETADGQKLLAEETTLRVYNLPDTGRFLDLTTIWTAAYQGIFFGDTKEAGNISVRVAESMEEGNGGTIVNAHGAISEAECWGKRAPWVDYYGPVEGQTAGLAIFDHPTGFRHPTWWHVRNYGLFTANCWGLHDFTGDWSVRGDYALPQGKSLQFKYRVYLHAGDVKQADVAGRYLDFAHPPVLVD